MVDGSSTLADTPAVPPALSDIGIIELLECDTRPTLIIDLERVQHSNHELLHPVFTNASLKRLPHILDPAQVRRERPVGENELEHYSDFKRWATSSSTDGHDTDGLTTPVDYHDLSWTCSTLRKRWRILSGAVMGLKAHPPSPFASHRLGSQRGGQGNSTSSRYTSVRKEEEDSKTDGLPTWVDDLPASEHVQLFKSTNWSATALGPLESWSICLRQMTQLLMSDSRAAALLWGPERVFLYNEAYIAVADRKHPGMMGATLKDSWAEVADDIESGLLSAERLGRATSVEDATYYLRRHGYLEETYFSYNLVPVRAANGDTEGFYNAAFETTRQNIWERRTFTLLSTVSAPAMASYWREVLKGFESNEWDIPLAVIYSLERAVHDKSHTSTIHLQATLGVNQGHLLAPKCADLLHGSDEILPLLQATMSANGPTVFQRDDESLPESLLQGVEWRGFGEPSNALAVLPLTAGEETLGFLLLGLNPRRAYDDDYGRFLYLLNRQLSTSLTTAALMEQANLKQAELSKHLAEGESRFKALTELNAAGLFYVSPRGQILYANDTCTSVTAYSMTGLSRDDLSDMAFMSIILEEDRHYLEQEWYNLIELMLRRTFEIRITHKWYHKESGTWKHKWIIASCGQVVNEDGSLKSVVGSITDISLLKQAQEDALERATLSEKLAQSQKEANEIQVRSRIEAEEARSSMEKFMDITSHEMRNPLSAIVQSADGIASSLLEFQSSSKTPIVSNELVESNLEAIQIINLCAQHQGRIINDVLTLSKLDSAMLQVSPTPAQPPVVVKGVLKMFEGEVMAHDIELEFSFEKSYQHFHIEWVMLDPSRVTQILVNLITNAIKFTRTSEKREIKVSVGGSETKPPSGEGVDLEWFPSRGISSKKDLTVDEEWGKGDSVFVYFAVKDTGRGVSSEEKARLFHRFAQANPRTHVKYGGSGLGLFISRELTELHGGEIGLFSEAGKGSTFAFYVKGRRASTPAGEITQQVERQSIAYRPRTPLKSKTNPLSDSPRQPTGHGDQSEEDQPNFQVLLVEDNLVNQKVLSKQLQKAGCTVYLANHGQEALDFLQTSKLWKDNPGGESVDVVLLDLEMPVMDGLTCARRIRELQAQGTLIRHVPLIAVTANARQEQIQTTMAAGIDDVMPKPFRVPDLMIKIQAQKQPK